MDDFTESDCSIDPSSIKSSNTRGISALETWQHSRSAGEDEPKTKKNRKLRYCRYCSSYSTYTTTNFRQHLSSKHNIEISPQPSKVHEEINDQFQKLCLKAKKIDCLEEILEHAFEEYLNQEVINEALVSLITTRNLPNRCIEWPELHAFALALNPKAKSILSTAHSTVPKLIESSFQMSKDIIRKKLQSAISRIHLSLDVWTSPNQHLFLAIVGHFVDADQTRQNALLALRTIPNHTGEEQANIVLSVLQEYDIVQSLGIIMGDNASNNNTLCRTMSKYLEENGTGWDFQQERLRCLGHIINLVVQAFLFHDHFEIEELRTYDEEEPGCSADTLERAKSFRKMGPLGKLHNIVVHIRGSTQRTKDFVASAGRKIPLDNRTRWNSWYQMILAATQNETAIDAYIKSHHSDLSKELLSVKDWITLRTIRDFLQPFYQATLATEGKNGTLDQVLHTMDLLFKVFQIAKVFFFLKFFI